MRIAMMRSSALWFKSILKILLGIVSTVVLFCILLFPITWPLLLMWLTACSTTTERMSISGYDIRIDETLCKTLAATYDVQVFISKRGDRKQALLFRYDPASAGHPSFLPSIRFSDPHMLLISVDEISSISFRRYKWENLSIEYDIRSITYPNPHEVQELE